MGNILQLLLDNLTGISSLLDRQDNQHGECEAYLSVIVSTHSADYLRCRKGSLLSDSDRSELASDPVNTVSNLFLVMFVKTN